MRRWLSDSRTPRSCRGCIFGSKRLLEVLACGVAPTTLEEPATSRFLPKGLQADGDVPLASLLVERPTAMWALRHSTICTASRIQFLVDLLRLRDGIRVSGRGPRVEDGSAEGKRLLFPRRYVPRAVLLAASVLHLLFLLLYLLSIPEQLPCIFKLPKPVRGAAKLFPLLLEHLLADPFVGLQSIWEKLATTVGARNPVVLLLGIVHVDIECGTSRLDGVKVRIWLHASHGYL
mmetsp:Transcript_44491/g.118158  ORF Transcript_44491/g.118158 Transcript_44491/m.118158 type:complete len:233 (+) Transcript_44491:416-1114(+)